MSQSCVGKSFCSSLQGELSLSTESSVGSAFPSKVVDGASVTVIANHLSDRIPARLQGIFAQDAAFTRENIPLILGTPIGSSTSRP